MTKLAVDKVTDENVHKLLRIVWVYVESQGVNKVVEQGTLPEELANDLVNRPEQLEDMQYKVILPYREVDAALEKLLAIFNKVYLEGADPNDPKFKPPWPESNPCQDGRIRFRR